MMKLQQEHAGAIFSCILLPLPQEPGPIGCKVHKTLSNRRPKPVPIKQEHSLAQRPTPVHKIMCTHVLVAKTCFLVMIYTYLYMYTHVYVYGVASMGYGTGGDAICIRVDPYAYRSICM